MQSEVEALFERPAEEGTSLALVILHHGELVVERYGVRPPNLFQPEAEPITRVDAADLVEHGEVDDPRRSGAARR